MSRRTLCLEPGRCSWMTTKRGVSTWDHRLSDFRTGRALTSSSDASGPLRPSLIDLPEISESRGDLTFIEGGRHIPFDIARVYYLHDVPFGSDRGGHAHRRLQQAIIALSGRFLLRLHDGTSRFEFEMMNPSKAVLVPPMTWRELLDFSSGAVCLVLASRPYEEEDYIRDFSQFVAEVRG